MADLIQLRRGTTTQWNTVNPILAQAEIGIELDNITFVPTGLKIGNGSDDWTTLPYFFNADHLQVVQGSAVTAMTINHGLNKRPSVTILDASNMIVYADVEILSLSVIEITFGSLFTGIVLLN
jgi:hypothetical protein